jgi:N-6 DNA methylase
MDLGERPEEITSAAIARLAGVGRAAVSNWRRRYPEFPQPVGGTKNSPTFDRAEVEQWLIETGKADQLVMAGQTDTGTQRISEPEIFEPERSISSLMPDDLLARAMVALLPHETALSPAPDPSLVRTEDLPVVLDPACGDATLLLAVADRFGDQVRLAGQEIDEKLAEAAFDELRSNPAGTAYEVYSADSLLDDRLAQYTGRAAAVVCEPPFDRPDWPAGKLATDARWEFGIPAPQDGELAWVQHCYAHLRPRGMAVIAVSARTCVQQSGATIREAMIRSGSLWAVIELPHQMTSVPGASSCLWVLRRPHGEDGRVPVRLVDLSGLAGPADVPRDHAEWARLLDGADPDVSVAVPRIDLLRDYANILPSRHVAPRAAAGAGDMAAVTRRLEALYAAVGRGLPAYAAPAEAARMAYVTVAELDRVGALTIRPRDATPRRGDVLLRTQGRPPVVATGTPADDKGVAQVVEIDETRLDSHFIAVFLRADVAAMPTANTLGAVNRDDLRRCRIPRMPLAEQRRYGDAFRRLLELETALRALAAVSGKVIEQVIHGLTSGVVMPGNGASEGETR